MFSLRALQFQHNYEKVVVFEHFSNCTRNHSNSISIVLSPLPPPPPPHFSSHLHDITEISEKIKRIFIPRYSLFSIFYLVSPPLQIHDNECILYTLLITVKLLAIAVRVKRLRRQNGEWWQVINAIHYQVFTTFKFKTNGTDGFAKIRSRRNNRRPKNSFLLSSALLNAGSQIQRWTTMTIPIPDTMKRNKIVFSEYGLKYFYSLEDNYQYHYYRRIEIFGLYKNGHDWNTHSTYGRATTYTQCSAAKILIDFPFERIAQFVIKIHT